MEYAYTSFRRQMLEGLGFWGGPAAGAPLPNFSIARTDCRRVHKADFLGRPLLLICGSITCPMTASASPVLKRLHAEFGDRIAFATLYVREAHPGDNFPQPRTFGQKLGHALAYRDRDAIPWPILVDDVQGTLHRALSSLPCATYLVDAGGRVFFRSLWSNDPRVLRQALAALARGDAPAAGQDERRFLPLLRGLGGMHEVLSRAGQKAKRDALRQILPLYVVSRIAGLFRPLPHLARSVAALTTGVLGLAAAVLVLGLLTRRAGRAAVARPERLASG